jgi:glycosyltransferase involved in cell wall biosynthesis
VRWANALAQRGIEVHLVSQHPKAPDLAPSVAYHPLLVRGPLGYFANVLQVRRLLRRLSPDLVHAHYASGYGTLGRLCGFRPNMLSVWGSDVYASADESRWLRAMVCANLAAADCVASTSAAMAERARFLCPGIRRLEVTPFGVDPARFFPAMRPEPDLLTVGTVKGLRPIYGTDILLRGFARCLALLRREAPVWADRVRLRIVGDGPRREEYESLSRVEGIAAVTEFVGAVEHARVPEELRRMDVFVAVSRHESFGVAVVEALYCGLPVVVSDVEGLPEVVAGGRTGLIVPPEDPEALAQALQRLIVRPDLRRELGRAGRSDVMARYDWSRNVDQMVGIYATLARPRRHAA